MFLNSNPFFEVTEATSCPLGCQRGFLDSEAPSSKVQHTIHVDSEFVGNKGICNMGSARQELLSAVSTDVSTLTDETCDLSGCGLVMFGMCLAKVVEDLTLFQDCICAHVRVTTCSSKQATHNSLPLRPPPPPPLPNNEHTQSRTITL